jgi:hypothetical protein
LSQGIKIEDIASVMHRNLSLSEAFLEAVLSAKRKQSILKIGKKNEFT